MKNIQEPEISIVVPFYNEEENIEELYKRLTETLKKLKKSYELIFVDDGSSDKTYQILCELHKKDKHVNIVKLKKNFGQTAALAAGFDHAEGKIIISMDGDLQHDPADIPKLLDKMEEGYDIVSGWRKKRVDNLIFRRIPSLVANRIMRFLSGVKIHDFGTTFKAYKKEVIKNIHLYGELHRFIPALASRMGVRITEVPIKNIVRQRGKSKYGLSRVRRVLFDLLTVKFIISFIDRPLQFFGLIGLGFGSVGFIIALILTIGFYFFNLSIRENLGNLLFSIFLMILGIQFIMTGLLAEIISRVYFATHKTKIYFVEETKFHRNKEKFS
ncbi:glycosyltransferase family 2 protein [Candidatus Aminicenantes bacterium AC-708-M15]|jgi:glycosyltransferase involved in cell wall biosynthesis|nr:glycosyltransferase family 2 protein [SCandidatus Aminicenantes bacterium Aminicenantia_JdfR_composite]MCP2596579.1 glycosyltransferase family 2 protein [Candidatus Aminicenantes bacterium AC-335-G13]MCP2598177.1 glycosyltransferase family 2 protein [Candidatus Aminicenantes bacterium AC-335-L06]MCP2604387.1 glycosyltransferase family 2 protein [Candidatus Aminicenantes bacterium AC-708-M15]MCP2620993.1 glycosyltransferase family 2 protein [Candidatus Aminicenantes bacterium AC-334-E05]